MDPFLVPVQLAIIAVYFARFPILSHAPEPARSRFSIIACDVKFSLGDWKKTILIPIVVVLLMYLAWVGFYFTLAKQLPTLSLSDPLPVFVVGNGVLAPLAEEILQCTLLTSAFIAFTRIYKNRQVVNTLLGAGLLVIAFLFAIIHTNPTPINFLVRFLGFTVYGAFYYLNDRNILPAVIAHAAWNFCLIIPV